MGHAICGGRIRGSIIKKNGCERISLLPDEGFKREVFSEFPIIASALSSPGLALSQSQDSRRKIIFG